MNIAIIPARGGSKRIPRKNIRPFCGKPMIGWAIEAVIRSGCCERVFVSTDDAEIAEIARAFGAEIPFMRPDDLSDDMTGTTDVIAHAVTWAEGQGMEPGLVTCAYATAPFLQATDLQAAHRAMEEGKWDYVFSATGFPAPIERAFRVSQAGAVGMDHPEHFLTRSQDLEPAFHDAGQFYVGTPDAWKEKRRLFDAGSSVIELPSWRVQDVDTQEDWRRAELMFKALGFAGGLSNVHE